MDYYNTELELSHLQDREIKDLSGGELQRFAIAVMCIQAAQVYMFDEPSSYLDVKQRLHAAAVIRELQCVDNYIIVVEHDLAVLDYLSDFVCCLWGSAGAYGVVTMPFSVREGINIFLDGFVPTENLRFREVSLTFRVAEDVDDRDIDRNARQQYGDMEKIMGTKFKLEIKQGDYADSEIIVMLGQNGTGKTTFIRMLAGLLKPDKIDEEIEMPEMHVSYKPQIISAKFEGTVKDLLLMKIRDAYLHPQFQTDVTKPMLIDQIADHQVQTLSGGELQRVAIVLALGKPADIYLIDEPSAYLDVEQRVVAARVLKRYILHAKKTAFIVEHDFIMATYLADRVIVYEGEPGVHCIASAPMSLLEGMNRFLEQLKITFRRDPTNFRPRINKAESVKDREQKQSGSYFVLED
jgi:ATP-binding cassette subfamily E protein 1